LAAFKTSPKAPSLKLSIVDSSNSMDLSSVKITFYPSVIEVSSLSKLSRTVSKSFSLAAS